MEQGIIESKDYYDSSYIKPIDEQIFHDIVKLVYNFDLNDESILYESIYQSKYKDPNIDAYKTELDETINRLKMNANKKIETDNQGSSYEWVYLKRNEIPMTSYRFYFGVNPEFMHIVSKELTIKLYNLDIPVSFKYQKEAIKNNCDRIILYVDSKNKDAVEKAIEEIYNEKPELFKGSERALSWIYNSNVPGVYFAPECFNRSKSYGEEVARSIADSKKIFNYMFGVTDSNPFVSRNPQKELEALKEIVLSVMLRNGVLLSKDGRRISSKELGIKTFYEMDTGVLKNLIDDPHGLYHEVKYSPTKEGRLALIDNFYSVKDVRKREGMQTKTLTREERLKEIYNFLYPQNTSSNMK